VPVDAMPEYRLPACDGLSPDARFVAPQGGKDEV
jgi:hypothetical protein